jgi:hypothetical protein
LFVDFDVLFVDFAFDFDVLFVDFAFGFDVFFFCAFGGGVGVVFAFDEINLHHSSNVLPLESPPYLASIWASFVSIAPSRHTK